MSEDKLLFDDERSQLNEAVQLNKDWKFEEIFPTITAYTTTYNCITGNYPFIEVIKSWLSVCDELIVMDGGSTDGTVEMVRDCFKDDPKVKLEQIPIQMDMPGKDGNQKALSRAMAMNQYCVQFDADEFRFGDSKKWKRLFKDMPDNVDLQNLFVLEPFNDPNNIRTNKEHNNLKWRISRNKSEITHGIPKSDQFEKDGKIFSKGGSDGCFPIHMITQELYPTYTAKYESNLSRLKNLGNWDEYKKEIELLLLNQTPCVIHVGHLNLKQKIKLYLNSWGNWWCDLYNKDSNDPQNNLYFPGIKFEDVTDEMIDKKVAELVEKTLSVRIDYEYYAGLAG